MPTDLIWRGDHIFASMMLRFRAHAAFWRLFPSVFETSSPRPTTLRKAGGVWRLPEMTLDQIESVPSVSEAAATGEIAEIYSDVRD
jgi:hypothetical protein